MPERDALGNLNHDGGEAPMIGHNAPGDFIDRRLVGDLQLAAERVAQQMLS